MKYYRAALSKINQWLKHIEGATRVFSGMGKAILFTALLFLMVILILNIFTAAGPVYFLARLLAYVGIGLAFALLISFLIRLAASFTWTFQVAIAFTLITIFHFYPGLSKSFRWLLTLFLIVLPALIACGIYLRRKGKNRNRKDVVWGSLLLSFGFLGLLGGLYFIFGFSGSARKLPSQLTSTAIAVTPLQAPDPAAKGSYEVGRLSYGSGEDKHRAAFGSEVSLTTPTVDASRLLKTWDGFFGKIRSRFFGFDATSLPLNALVWYPERAREASPLVLIVHGNHLAEDFSESGYAYLGELLASKGYIVASVDENFLNISAAEQNEHLKNENATRGWLLLKHLELWRQWNADPSHRFYGKVDMQNISLIGHSRGGEAIGHAALFNSLPSYPEDATMRFDFNFGIRALVAIAPVDGQYKPGNGYTSLRDINYLVLHGAQDMDMKSYGGLAPYHRLTFSQDFQGFKAGLYIFGANHGQFNSEWGRHDQHFPGMTQYNVNQLMEPQDQEQIASVYISAFLESTLKGKMEYMPLFMDYRYGRQWLPETRYYNQFDQNGTVAIATYEEDLNVETASLEGATISAENLSLWHEKQHQLMWNANLTRATWIGWDPKPGEEASYTLTLPDSLPLEPTGRMLTFSLAESREGRAARPEKVNLPGIDFTLVLTDHTGERLEFPLSACKPLQPPMQKQLTKWSLFEEGDPSETIPDFFYFDLDALAQKNPEFRLQNLQSIQFLFNRTPSGSVILDNIGFMRGIQPQEPSSKT